MQKVAWPITIVQIEKLSPAKTKNEFSAIPVMIPGSAIGRISRNEIDSRPKKRKRWIAKAAADPSTSAAAVASSATRTESQSAERTSESFQASRNQWKV